MFMLSAIFAGTAAIGALIGIGMMFYDAYRILKYGLEGDEYDD